MNKNPTYLKVAGAALNQTPLDWVGNRRRIMEAMRLIWERMKIVVEPSAAVPLAALLHGVLKTEGRRIGVIVSGGNVDLERLPWRT